MGVVFGDRECIDPVALWEDARVVQPPLPTWNWWGKVNSFRCPTGQEPGRGWLLLHRGDLDALDLNATHDLTLSYARTVTVKSLLVVHAECITPRELDAKQPAYVVEVADKRHLLKSFSPLIDKAYNVRQSPGSTSFLSATLNTGSEWTWTTLVTDLWNTVGTSRLGTFPGLPFSPHGNPEGWEFFQTSAYDALGQVLDRLCCTLTLNPSTGAFGIARVGSTDAALATALLRWDAARIWDDDALEPAQARLPQYVRVLFRRQPEPSDGNSPWYSVDVADTDPVTGAYSGGYVSVHDDLAALASSGTPSNSAALALRAAERAADWFRATKEGWSRLRKVYRDVIPETGFAPGSQLTGYAVEDRGLGYKTELARSGAFRDLARAYGGGRLSDTLTPVCWARITEYNSATFAYDWVEAEPITPTSGTFATASGTSFGDKTGGRSGDANLYERNRFPNVPLDSYVLIYQGYGNTYLFEYDYDHFPGVISVESGGGIYTVVERYPPDTLGAGLAVNKRTVSASEFNTTPSIPVGTRVLVWVYNVGGVLSYWFDHPYTGKAAGISYTVVNESDVTVLTGVDGHLYFNTNDMTWYIYSATYGWFPWCCATGETGTGSGGGAVPTDCQDEAVSQDLVVTISAKTGACTCVADDTLEYFTGDPAPAYPTWTQAHAFSGCPNESSLSLVCREGTWYLTGTNLIGGSGQAPDSENADGDPLELVWNNLDGSGVCGGAGTFTITITEAP